jgi:hypothetical protein
MNTVRYVGMDVHRDTISVALWYETTDLEHVFGIARNQVRLQSLSARAVHFHCYRPPSPSPGRRRDTAGEQPGRRSSRPARPIPPVLDPRF